jgi:ribonuclease Z
MSCRNLVAHVGDAFIQSGEIAQRISEDKRRLAGGPAEMGHLVTFEPRDEPQVVWSKDDIKVSAIRSTHIAGHAVVSRGHARWQCRDRR